MRGKKLLSGYLVGRFAVLGILMPLAALYMNRHTGVEEATFRGFFLLTAGAFLFTLITSLLVRARQPGRSLMAAQCVWEVLYATALIYLSGGFFSPFIFLYLLSIVGAAMILSRQGAMATATLAAIAYALLSFLQMKGIVSPLNPFLVEMPGGASLLIRLSFHVVAFFAVAFLSGHLAEELRSAGESLEKAQDEILALEDLQAAILQSMGSGLIALDSRGQVMLFNSSAEILMARVGLSPARYGELFGLDPSARHEVEVPGSSGFIIGYSVFPLSDRNGRNIGKILTFQDLTEFRKLEKELRRADRMAAVGRLAAGLAHEIRNPLASLSGSVQLLETSLAEEHSELGILFGIIQKETERLNHLVTDFLGYARPGDIRLSVFRLAEFFQEVGFFFSQGEGRDRFAMTLEMPSELQIEADREQLESLVLNLFRNSIEAAERQVNVKVCAAKMNDSIVLTIEDDGPGMPREIYERAFEPFVSGKQNGTGLGLSTVHRIVQGHRGTISIENTLGKGVLFRILLPATQTLSP